MYKSNMKILIIGFSTRAIAESAKQCGYPFLTVDYFGDYDQKLIAENFSLLRDGLTEFSPQGLLAVSKKFNFDAVVYTSNLDNYPALIAELSGDHLILGNSPETLAGVRDWHRLKLSLERAGIRTPTSLFSPPEHMADDRKWLRKPIKSGGGRKIEFWAPGDGLGEEEYLQEFKTGICCSAALIANGEDCSVIGLSEQLVGLAEFGARGFCYVGNIFPLRFTGDENGRNLKNVWEQVAYIAKVITREFSLKGLNSLDFILDSAYQVHLLEVNPRYSGSMELMEWAYGVKLFQWHLESFQGHLPTYPVQFTLTHSQQDFFAKAILYAEKNIMIPDTHNWVKKGIKDIPFAGDVILEGSPICTVFSTGNSRKECFDALFVRGLEVKNELYSGGDTIREG